MEWVQSTPSRVYQTIHYAPTGTADQSKHASPLVSVTAWHTYAVDRTDDVLIFYVDGQELGVLRIRKPIIGENIRLTDMILILF